MKKKSTKLNPENALSQLMDLCSRSEKSPFEVEKKIKEWGLEAQKEAILDTLKKENFIDANRFATAFSRDKYRFNKWGKIKIRYYLKGHRIDDITIEEVLFKIDKEEYSSMVETEMEKKLKSLKVKDPYQIKAKLYAFGNQRGYEPEMMHRYFDSEEF